MRRPGRAPNMTKVRDRAAEAKKKTSVHRKKTKKDFTDKVGKQLAKIEAEARAQAAKAKKLKKDVDESEKRIGKLRKEKAAIEVLLEIEIKRHNDAITMIARMGQIANKKSEEAQKYQESMGISDTPPPPGTGYPALEAISLLFTFWLSLAAKLKKARTAKR